jgi:hypothetical protein
MTAPIVRNEVAPTEVRPGVGEGAGGSKSNPQTGQTQCIKGTWFLFFRNLKT